MLAQELSGLSLSSHIAGSETLRALQAELLQFGGMPLDWLVAILAIAACVGLGVFLIERLVDRPVRP